VHVVAPAGQPVLLQGVMVDITARKHLEAEQARLQEQLQATQRKLGLQDAQIRLGELGVHAKEHLACLDRLAFPNQDIPHDTGICRLHDLQETLRHELSRSNRHDIDAAQDDACRCRDQGRGKHIEQETRIR
jgi:hypothetical protein